LKVENARHNEHRCEQRHAGAIVDRRRLSSTPCTDCTCPAGWSQGISATARNIGSSTIVRGIAAAPNARLMAPSQSAINEIADVLSAE